MTAISKCHDRFSESTIDEEIVLMQIDTGEFYSLQGTGRAIWQLIDEAPRRTALLDALSARFDAPHETLVADVDAFLAMLTDAGFVTTY